MAAHLHAGDVDVVAGQDRAHRADDARLVAVVGDEHVAGERAVESEAVDLHDGGVVAIPAHGDVVGEGAVVPAHDLEGEVGRPRGLGVAGDDAEADAAFSPRGAGR